MKHGRILALFCALLLVLVFAGTRFSAMTKRSAEQQEQTLEQALNRSLTSYYALEGVYPQSLDELLTAYPVLYDTKQFFIDYQPVGANLPPDITILSRRQP